MNGNDKSTVDPDVATAGSVAVPPIKATGIEISEDGAKGGIENDIDEPGNSATENSEASGPVQTKVESPTGLFDELLNNVSSGEIACDCGKPPGERGRHKETCATRKAKTGSGGSSGHNVSVVLPKSNGALAATPAIAGAVTVVAPADYSFYGKLIKTLASARSKFRCEKILAKVKPVLGEQEAEAIAEEQAISNDDLRDLAKDMTECAAKEQWPEVHPIGKVLMTLTNIEFHNWLADRSLDKRLKKIEDALKNQQPVVAADVAQSS